MVSEKSSIVVILRQAVETNIHFWHLILFLSEGNSIIVGPSVVTTKNLSVVHLPLCVHCMHTEPCCTMIEPLYAVSIVSSFFVEPGIGCPRSFTLSGNILRKVRRESVLPSAPVSTFAFNVWVPGLSGSLICNSVKISVRLSLFAAELHLTSTVQTLRVTCWALLCLRSSHRFDCCAVYSESHAVV